MRLLNAPVKPKTKFEVIGERSMMHDLHDIQNMIEYSWTVRQRSNRYPFTISFKLLPPSSPFPVSPPGYHTTTIHNPGDGTTERLADFLSHSLRPLSLVHH